MNESKISVSDKFSPSSRLWRLSAWLLMGLMAICMTYLCVVKLTKKANPSALHTKNLEKSYEEWFEKMAVAQRPRLLSTGRKLMVTIDIPTDLKLPTSPMLKLSPLTRRENFIVVTLERCTTTTLCAEFEGRKGLWKGELRLALASKNITKSLLLRAF